MATTIENAEVVKDEDGKFIWPGFGDNSRVLEWVFNRCDDEGETIETSIGLLPKVDELDLDGVDVTPEQMDELLTVDDEAVAAQLPQIEEHLAKFGDDLPEEIRNQLDALKSRLGA